MKPRTAGPSFSRKNVLKTENVRKKMSDVNPSMPRATPWSSVAPASATPLSTSLLRARTCRLRPRR